MADCFERIFPFRFLSVFYETSKLAQTSTNSKFRGTVNLPLGVMVWIGFRSSFCTIMDHFILYQDFTWPYSSPMSVSI